VPSTAPRRLTYRREAQRDLDDLFDFIAAERPIAAMKFLGEIKRACEGLSALPWVGRNLDPNDDRVRVLSLRRRVAIKYLVLDRSVHILGVTYRGRDLNAFFAERKP
jgi:toxin ParE1/3/4